MRIISLLLSLLLIVYSFIFQAQSRANPPAKADAHTQRAWIDKFGQNTKSDWAQKIHTEAELAQADENEQKILDAQKPFRDRDEFGGWTKGVQVKASGFFRLEKIENKWWLVTPSGHLYYTIAIDCIAPEAFTKLSGENRAAYTWLPASRTEFGAAQKDNAISFYVLNLIRKWGKDWQEKFNKRAIERTKSWGFTGFGNWSDENIQHRKMPYVSMGPSTWELKVPYIDGDIADVYDPNFTSEVFRVAAKLSEHKNDEFLIGYFLDNEMPWWNIPTDVLALDEKQACKKYWIGRLKVQYGNIHSLNKSWGCHAKDFNSLRWPGDKANKNATADMISFRRDFAERFYDAWYRAIKKADPNHLVLGSRIPYPMDDVALACARHTDVLSFNYYSTDFGDKFDRYYKLTGKPIMIGEYDFDSLDNGLLKAFVPVANQEERGKGYSFYTESAAAKPYMVGTHYFQYIDEPLTGRGDGESSFNGFVSVADIPYPKLVEAAKRTNARIYELHNGSLQATKERPLH